MVSIAPKGGDPLNAAPDAPMRVLYIGGEGRSGTTLLDQVLGQLPGVTGTGELFAIWEHGVLDDDRCGCGEAFSRCPMWSEVGRRAFGGWSADQAVRLSEIRQALVRDRYAPWLIGTESWRSTPQQGQLLIDSLDRLYRSIASVTSCDVIVDSSKSASYAMALARVPRVDLRIVQLVRDARGAAYSWTKRVAKPEATSGYQVMDRYPPTVTAARWLKTDLLFLALRARGVPLLTIRYEDLIADMAGALRRISDFADLPVRPGHLDLLSDAAVELSPTHTVAGNPSRFRTGEIRLKIDEKWRDALPLAQRLAVTGVAAPGLLRHGYLKPRSGRSARPS